jgi:hypothetical protein
MGRSSPALRAVYLGYEVHFMERMNGDFNAELNFLSKLTQANEYNNENSSGNL